MFRQQWASYESRASQLLGSGSEEDGTAGESSPDEPLQEWRSQLRAARWISALSIVLALVGATVFAIRWPASAVEPEDHPAEAGVIELSDARIPPSQITAAAGKKRARRGDEDDAELQIEQGVGAMAAHLFGPPADEDDGEVKPFLGIEHKKADAPKLTIAEESKRLLDSLAVGGDGWYRVNINSVVRSGPELNSSKVSVAPAGIFVHIAEKKGRRVRVDKAAASLEKSKVVKGWMSMQTADGRLQILRPSKQAALLDGRHNMTAGKLAMIRAQYDSDAVRIAKVTAYQQQLTENLQKVNVSQVAHGLVQFGKNRQKFEEQGLKTAQQAGEHVGKTIEQGANSILGAIDGWTRGGGNESKGSGAKVGELSIPMPKKEMVQSIFNTFKQGLANANIDDFAGNTAGGAQTAWAGR